MGVSTKEEGMLKLVHPGRIVEIHTEPITAAEIMRKNPRHCIARPDVFKFPWIVVRPESVLFPGNVFYIVPNRTLYRLLKDSGCLEKPPSKLNQTLKNHKPKHFSKQDSNLKSRVGLTRKHPNNYRGLGVSPREQESDESLITLSKIESWAEVIFKNKHNQKKFDLGDQVISLAKKDRRKILPKNENCDVQVKSCRQTNVLKSCLRQPDSVRKLHKFRVTFALPITSDGQCGAR